MNEPGHLQSRQSSSCGCFTEPNKYLILDKELGLGANYAEITLLICTNCGQTWLRYFYENEAFTASGRWYLGAINDEQVSVLTVTNAKAILESLSWYFYGGSYYRGRSGKTAGKIYLNP